MLKGDLAYAKKAGALEKVEQDFEIEARIDALPPNIVVLRVDASKHISAAAPAKMDDCVRVVRDELQSSLRNLDREAAKSYHNIRDHSQTAAGNL